MVLSSAKDVLESMGYIVVSGSLLCLLNSETMVLYSRAASPGLGV
jgi:hypothetical protein